MSLLRREKCSWMNDTKWTAVLGAIETHRLLCRIKLLWHDYADSVAPGSPVITAFDSHGKPDYLRPELIWRTSPTYWEASGIGPFRMRDIEWLALPARDCNAIRAELPQHLKLLRVAEEAVIVGYEFE